MLAVVSVPMSVAVHAIPWVAGTKRQATTVHEYDGQMVFLTRQWSPMRSTWSCRGQDAAQARALYESGDVRNAPVALVDPRPPLAATLLDGGDLAVVCERFGWPLRSSYLLGRATPSPGRAMPGTRPATLEGAWRTTLFGRDWVAPYLPLWPGLLGNAAFYALLTLPVLALLRLRMFRRRARRGLCLACAYELGEGVAKCPECGLTRA